MERFVDRFLPLGVSGCDDEGGKLLPGLNPKLNYFVTGQLSDCDIFYDITADESAVSPAAHPSRPAQPWGELWTRRHAVSAVAQGRRFGVEWLEWPDEKVRSAFIQWRARDPKRLAALVGQDDTRKSPRETDADFLTYSDTLRIFQSFLRGEARPPQYRWRRLKEAVCYNTGRRQ